MPLVGQRRRNLHCYMRRAAYITPPRTDKRLRPIYRSPSHHCKILQLPCADENRTPALPIPYFSKTVTSYVIQYGTIRPRSINTSHHTHRFPSARSDSELHQPSFASEPNTNSNIYHDPDYAHHTRSAAVYETSNHSEHGN